LDYIFDSIKKRSLEAANSNLDDPDWFKENFGWGGNSSSGVAVNRRSILAHPAVWRACNLLSTDVGKTPLDLFKRDENDGRQKDKSHPAYYLMRHKPNRFMSALDWKRTMVFHSIIDGNGYSQIVRRGGGESDSLIILPPDNTHPAIVIDPKTNESELIYVTYVNGVRHALDASEVWHLKGLSDNGITGYSLYDVACESLGMGLAAQRFTAIYFKNSARPSTLISPEDDLNEESAKLYEQMYRRWTGGVDNAHKALVLPKTKITPISHNAKEAQLIELMDMSVRQVANLTSVPPHKLGDQTRAAYNSIEAENKAYLAEGLDGKLVAFEMECNDKLLTTEEKRVDSHYFEFNRRAIIGTDIEVQNRIINLQLMEGLISYNEARSKLNMNPLPPERGDVFLTPLNMQQSQADGSDTDNEDDNNVRQAMSSTLSDLLSQTLDRMNKRIAMQAKRKAKEPDKINDWIEKLQKQNWNAVREAMDQPLSAIRQLHEDDSLDTDAVCKDLFDRWRDLLLSATEVKEDHLQASIIKATNRFKNITKNIINEILGGYDDQNQ